MIVGIGYNMRVGKDSAAQALARELGFERRAFADALKQMATIVDPLITPVTGTVNVGAGKGRLKWTIQGMGWEEAKSVFPEVRRFLQELGTAGRTVLGEDVWVRAVLDHVGAADRVVIPDVRYVNEAEAIKEAGGRLLKIVRPGHTGDSHPSERDLDDYDGWDAVITNNGSLMELEDEVVRQVRTWVVAAERGAQK